MQKKGGESIVTKDMSSI